MGNKEEQNSSLPHRLDFDAANQNKASAEASISQLQTELLRLRAAYARLEYERNLLKKALLTYQRKTEMEKEILLALTR